MTEADKDHPQLQLKIDEYSDMLFKLSYMRLQNVQDAEDVVQEVFYQYFKSAQSFESPEHEKAWLLKVAMNACRKMWRSAWRRHQSDWSPEDESRIGAAADEKAAGEEMLSTFSGPEDAVVRQEERSRLLEAVWKLPERYRDVIHLFYYEELSVKEIARVTGRGVSTVTSQLTRGREQLKKSLREDYDFE